MIRGFYGNNLDDARLQDTPIGQTDLERLHRSQLGGQFWSAYVPWYGPISVQYGAIALRSL